MRQYITIQNFDDISKAVKEIQAQAVARDCALGSYIDIVGTEAIERFKKEYCPDMAINTTNNPQPKTDGKTSAVILPYISAQVYGDSRDNEGRVIADRYCYQSYIIEYQIGRAHV